MKKFLQLFKDNFISVVLAVFFVGAIWLTLTTPPKQNPVLKEYKDGVQNHLIWNLKGECFFVRPNDDITVYLVRVNDCDKK